MTTYEDTRAIALTVSEILTLQCALWNCANYLERDNLPITARETRELTRKIDEQAKRWLEEANQVVEDYLNQPKSA